VLSTAKEVRKSDRHIKAKSISLNVRFKVEFNPINSVKEQSTSPPYYLIIADIFGDSAPLQRFADDLGKPFKIISPYSKPITFQDEADAYQYFMQHVGLHQYATLIEQQLENITSPVIVIAFSVGASSIWLLSDQLTEKTLGYLTQVNCFYSAQIRHYLGIEPHFPLRFIFPIEEIHFDIDSVIQQLENKPNVEVVKTPWMHGFMNALSINFSDKGYKQYLNQFKNSRFIKG
jgi:hypothetical protein